MAFKIGDRVKLKPEIKKIIGTQAYRMFIDDKNVYTVLVVCYDMCGEEMVELDNNGLHYLVQSCHLTLVVDKTVGFIIE